jgi:hypothetical protein
MLFADAPMPSRSVSTSPRAPTLSTTPRTPSTPGCEFVLSSKVFPEATRGKRGCKVCIFEGRTGTMKTIYCRRHNICLCSQTFPIDPELASVVCPHEDWDCGRKFHEYYLPRGLFNDHGRIRRNSTINKARRELCLAEAEEKTSEASGRRLVLTPYSDQLPAESPPTLVFSPFDGERENALASSDAHASHQGDSPTDSCQPSPDASVSTFATSSPAPFVGTPFTFVSSSSTVYI